MIHIKAPGDYSAYDQHTCVFLAGSIEMGAAEDWQDAITAVLQDTSALILNPRRDNWDASWLQSIENANFREQVEWELNGLDAADIIAFYFSPGTKAPITLMEFGACAAKSPEKMIVCCPEGFWRKGNVDILCARYNVQQVPSLTKLIEAIRGRL